MAERKYDKHHKIQYDYNYKREKMYSIAFRLHKESDAELIEVYKSIPDKAAWFREMLRNYMN